MGTIRNVFKKLIQGLYSIGTIVVGGTVGAVALGALTAYHAAYAIYKAYKKAWDGFYGQAAKFLTLGFLPYPLGPIIYGVGHVGSAAYDIYTD